MQKINFTRLMSVLKVLMKRAQTEEGKNEINAKFHERLKSAKGIDGVIHKVKLMYYYFMDIQVSAYKKILIGAILLYFINPMDIMPDVLPGAGLIDDTVAILYGWKLLKDELESYAASKRSGVVDEQGEVITDVEYSVKPEEDGKNEF